MLRGEVRRRGQTSDGEGQTGTFLLHIIPPKKDSLRSSLAAHNFATILTTRFARRRGCKDLVRIVLSKGKDEVKSKFYTWTHFVSSSKIKDLEEGALQDTLRLAASKIKMELMRGVLGKVSRAWRKWKNTLLYESVRAKNMFLGVDLARRALESFKKKAVVAALNTWLAALQNWKRRQREKRGGITTIDHVLRRLKNRTVATSFAHWSRWLAAEKTIDLR